MKTVPSFYCVVLTASQKISQILQRTSIIFLSVSIMTIIRMLHASYSAITDFFILYIACLQKMKVPKFFPVHTTAMPKNFTVRFPQSLRIRHAAVKPVEMSTKQPSVHELHRNTVLFRLILCMMQKLSETLSLHRPV